MNAILVCVDYSDLLAITLPHNRHHFNKVMVVTTPEDKDTIRLCESFPFLVGSYAVRDLARAAALFPVALM